MTYSLAGQRVCNVLHFLNAEETGSPDPTELGSRLVAWWNEQLKGTMTADVALTSVVVTPLEAEGEPALEYTTGAGTIGTSAGASLPNNVALVISQKTPFRGRSFRGRTYHFGISEAKVVLNTADPAYVTDLLGRYSHLLELDGSVGEPIFNLAVVSYWSQGALRATPLATAVTAQSCDGIIDSQRRRLPGRGN